jgi:hypothetical protein
MKEEDTECPECCVRNRKKHNGVLMDLCLLCNIKRKKEANKEKRKSARQVRICIHCREGFTPHSSSQKQCMRIFCMQTRDIQRQLDKWAKEKL